MSEKLYIARIGKSVALKGENRLTLDTDFPGQFQRGVTFETKRGPLTVEYYNEARGLIKFLGVNTPEDAKKLTNLELYTTMDKTKELCELDEGEHFWFDVVGCEVFDEGTLLGIVSDVDRIASTDYIIIKTDQTLIDRGLVKSFLIPYIENFIIDADIENKRIDVEGGLDILEAS